jgi:uncharacterized RmlC-like cupin family protein
LGDETLDEMPMQSKKLRLGGPYSGKQGFSYFEGISKETTGSPGICM